MQSVGWSNLPILGLEVSQGNSFRYLDSMKCPWRIRKNCFSLPFGYFVTSKSSSFGSFQPKNVFLYNLPCDISWLLAVIFHCLVVFRLNNQQVVDNPPWRSFITNHSSMIVGKMWDWWCSLASGAHSIRCILNQRLVTHGVGMQTGKKGSKSIHITICSYCGCALTDQHHWDKIRDTDPEGDTSSVSHGICPDCLRENFPMEYLAIQEERRVRIRNVFKKCYIQLYGHVAK